MNLKTCSKLLLVIIGAFLIWNGLWYLNKKAYEAYVKDYELYYTAYGKTEDMFQYTVSFPPYPHLQGNFAIGNLEDTLSIIMWPSLFAQEIKSYGVMLVDQGVTYQIYVDENLDYLEARKNKFLLEEKEIVKNLLTENKEELIKMLHLAHLEWEI